MTEPLRKPADTPRRGNPILTALMVLVIFVVGSGTLLALPTGFIGPVIVFGGLLFFGMIGFHYFVWGRWLTRVLQEEAADEDND